MSYTAIMVITRTHVTYLPTCAISRYALDQGFVNFWE